MGIFLFLRSLLSIRLEQDVFLKLSFSPESTRCISVSLQQSIEFVTNNSRKQGYNLGMLLTELLEGTDLKQPVVRRRKLLGALGESRKMIGSEKAVQAHCGTRLERRNFIAFLFSPSSL